MDELFTIVVLTAVMSVLVGLLYYAIRKPDEGSQFADTLIEWTPKPGERTYVLDEFLQMYAPHTLERPPPGMENVVIKNDVTNMDYVREVQDAINAADCLPGEVKIIDWMNSQYMASPGVVQTFVQALSFRMSANMVALVWFLLNRAVLRRLQCMYEADGDTPGMGLTITINSPWHRNSSYFVGTNIANDFKVLQLFSPSARTRKEDARIYTHLDGPRPINL
jgi:hypothetical protein